MYAILIVALSVALLSFLIMKLRFNAFFSLGQYRTEKGAKYRRV